MQRLVGADLEAGSHVVTWDGGARIGSRVRPGIYRVRLRAGDEVRTAAVVLLR